LNRPRAVAAFNSTGGRLIDIATTALITAVGSGMTNSGANVVLSTNASGGINLASGINQTNGFVTLSTPSAPIQTGAITGTNGRILFQTTDATITTGAISGQSNGVQLSTTLADINTDSIQT